MFKNKIIKTIRTPYEEITQGYYNFGNAFFVNIGQENKHSFYTEVHERTHLHLGVSSRLGLFHQFWYFLATQVDYHNRPHFIDEIFGLAVEEAREVHEAAATFNEFAQARHDMYSGLDDMLHYLPHEYKTWKGIYENFFHPDIPILAQGWLAECLSISALQIDIFNNFIPSQNANFAFKSYILSSQGNPKKRLLKIFKLISSTDQLCFWRRYLDVYNNGIVLYSLHEKDRAFYGRNYSMWFKSQLENAYVDCISALVNKMPELESEFRTTEQMIQEVNLFAKTWCDYLRTNGFADKCQFEVRRMDPYEMHGLETKAILTPEGRPQPGLYKIPTIEVLNKEASFIVRFWKNTGVMATDLSPTLKYKPNEIYLRIFQVGDNSKGYYLLHEGDALVCDLLNSEHFTIFIDGQDYNLIIKTKSYWNKTKATCFFFWKNFAEIPKSVFTDKIIHWNITSIKTLNSYLLVFKNEPNTFHIVFTPSTQGVSLLLSEIQRKSQQVKHFTIEEETKAMNALNFALLFVEYLF